MDGGNRAGSVIATIEVGEAGLFHAIGDFGMVSGESIEEVCAALPLVLAFWERGDSEEGVLRYVPEARLASALAALEEAREALKLTTAVLQAEMGRAGGQPFTGTWSIPALDIRSTVPEALDRADAALARIEALKGGADGNAG